MVMIDKITYLINGIIPGSIGILIFQNEIQVSLGHLPIAFVRKDLGGARQQERTVRRGVYDAALTKRSVRTRTRGRRCLKIFYVLTHMPGNGRKHLPQIVSGLQLIELEEGLIYVRRRSDQRGLRSNRATSGHPVERITPAIFIEVLGARPFEFIQELNCPSQIRVVLRCPKEK